MADVSQTGPLDAILQGGACAYTSIMMRAWQR